MVLWHDQMCSLIEHVAAVKAKSADLWLSVGEMDLWAHLEF